MATNPPKNNSRKGFVKKRMQFKNPANNLNVKYDLNKKRIIDVKTSKPKKPFKGVRNKFKKK